jgi:DNA processing protein
MSRQDMSPDRSMRLALLLAGGGARCRRLLASSAPGSDVSVELERRGLPAAMLRTVRQLIRSDVAEVLQRAGRDGWRWVVPGEPEFPALLRATADPPLGLFVKGRIRRGPAVAVVGSRRATEYGLEVGRLIAEALASSGIAVVSGMARGVDASAHRGALAGGGCTMAVWGNGPDRIYPREHRRLAESIARTGALVTEYPPGTPPRRHHFPERNRLIAGIAEATVVVEAAARSGALGTARLALEEGREVFAVPGPIFSDRSVGPNSLLRLGARPLLTPADLYEVVEPVRSPAGEPAAAVAGLLEHLPAGAAMSVDALAAEAGLDAAGVLAELLQLEVDGRVVRGLDGRFRRVVGIADAPG